MHNWFSPKAFALLAATLLAPALFTPAHAEVTPEVRQVYDRLANELTQHRAFAVDMTLEYTASVGEETQWLVTTYKVAYERPNRVAIKVENPHIQYDFYLENGLWTHYLPAVNQYVVQPAQMTAPELISRSGVGPIGDAMIIFMQIALAEPFKVPMQYALNSEYKGEVDVDGDLYDKVFLDFDAVKWDAWISKGDQPLLHRIVPQLPVVENHYMQQFQKHVELDVVMDFDNWNFNE